MDCPWTPNCWKSCTAMGSSGDQPQEELICLVRLSLAMRLSTSSGFVPSYIITSDNPGAMAMAMSMSSATSMFAPPGAPLKPSSKTLLSVTLGSPAKLS